MLFVLLHVSVVKQCTLPGTSNQSDTGNMANKSRQRTLGFRPAG